MLDGYVTTLRQKPANLVSAACDRIASRPGAFPPSAGDVCAECEAIAAERSALPLPKRVCIDRESRQGRAWDEYARRSGVKLMWIDGSRGYMASEWPPGCDEEVAAQWQRERDAARISELDAESLRRVVPGAFSAAE